MCRTFAAGAEPPYRGVMGEKQRVRKHRVTIHVDESEKQKLDGWSMQAGLRREAYLRKVLLENTVPVSADQAAAARQLAAEMGRIGNNEVLPRFSQQNYARFEHVRFTSRCWYNVFREYPNHFSWR